MSQSSSSYSYSSYSTTSSSSTSGGQQQVHATSSRQTAHTDSSGNTTIQTTQKNLGEPAVQETRYYDGSGREVVGGSEQARLASGAGGTAPRKIEDVTDEQKEADRLYEERIQDEYAKREGGA